MKRTLLAFLLCAAVAMPFCGCKKSESGGTPPPSGKPADKRAPSAPTETVELKMKWPVGNRYIYRMESDQNVQFKMPGMPKPMQQLMTMGQNYALSVLKETPVGGREMEFEFVSMEMDMRMNERTMMSFDSKGESTGEGVEAFRKLIGAKLKFLVSASNEVEKVEGYEELMNKLPGGGGMARQVYDENFFKRMMDVGRGLPDKPVKVGDKWPAQIDIVMGPMGKAVLNLDYTFKGWEDRDQHKCVLLDFTGTIKQPPGEKPAGPGPNFSIENGKIVGKNWFDPELGAMIGSDIDISMLMKMPAPGGGGGAPGQPAQTMSPELAQKIKFTLVELGKVAGGG
jgi:hypothetical protein